MDFCSSRSVSKSQSSGIEIGNTDHLYEGLKNKTHFYGELYLRVLLHQFSNGSLVCCWFEVPYQWVLMDGCYP